MTLSSDTAEAPARLVRFSTGERWIHRSIGILMAVLIVTAALLFIPDLGGLVGNRKIVRTIHEVAGFALAVPLLLALFSRAFRDDTGRLNRFHPSDWEWLRSKDRRSGRIAVGKFNAGQKLNAAFTLGAIILMYVTGTMMFFSNHFPDSLRTGATFVHDWLSFALIIVVVGHMYMAFNDASARMGMRTGSVPESWARREHRGWAEEQRPSVITTASSATTPATTPDDVPMSDDPMWGP
jgi:formate dehydrogenase subunit gamma